jgi:hypothetical protein
VILFNIFRISWLEGLDSLPFANILIINAFNIPGIPGENRWGSHWL